MASADEASDPASVPSVDMALNQQSAQVEITSEAFTASELEGATFNEAKKALLEEEVKYKAFKGLQDALPFPNVDELQTAIDEADKAAIPSNFIVEAKGVLELV